MLNEAEEQTEKIAEEAERNLKYLEADNNDVNSFIQMCIYCRLHVLSIK